MAANPECEEEYTYESSRILDPVTYEFTMLMSRFRDYTFPVIRNCIEILPSKQCSGSFKFGTTSVLCLVQVLSPLLALGLGSINVRKHCSLHADSE